jgi:hypothetical protein
VLATICFVLGSSIIALRPEVASAEWTEVSRPCGVGPSAIIPQPQLSFEVGEAVVSQPWYFTYGESVAVAPPVGNFTAIANWGDGTTSPATVEVGSVSGCYVVSALDHTYTNAGTYPFSYTVHDNKTGLDHVLGALELYLFSDVPSPLGGTSSPHIDATVGVPWSGVVGEFSYEDPFVLPGFYVAQIEWGDGEPSTLGTVSLESGDHAFTVSGSVTYERPFGGTISVLLWHDAALVGKWTTNSVDVPGLAALDRTPSVPVRLRGQPILAVIPRGVRGPIYEFVFRTNQPLSRTNSGRVGAKIEADGRTDPVSDLIARVASTCYVARTNRISKRILKAGAGYPFTLAIDAGSVTRDRGRASLRKFATVSRMRSIASRSLGCT